MEISPNSTRTILVCGALGNQGSAVVARLLEKGWKVRALTRRPESHGAMALAKKGVELAMGDLEDPESLDAALKGAYGVFSVQDGSVGAEREVLQGKNMADAAKKAGTEHFVYSSVAGADRNTGIIIWESKWEIEKHIRKLGLPATIFRPVSFFENYYIDIIHLGILMGRLISPVKKDRPYQMIATRDIGGFVQLAFERPEEFMGMELEIAGSALTNLQSTETFSRVTKRKVRFFQLPMWIAYLQMGKDIYKSFRWFNTSGYKADVPELRRRYPELKLKTLEQWLYDEGWDKHARRFTIHKDSGSSKGQNGGRQKEPVKRELRMDSNMVGELN
jgi:uncharacterized protein YbjT (DUF2867 family)